MKLHGIISTIKIIATGIIKRALYNTCCAFSVTFLLTSEHISELNPWKIKKKDEKKYRRTIDPDNAHIRIFVQA